MKLRFVVFALQLLCAGAVAWVGFTIMNTASTLVQAAFR